MDLKSRNNIKDFGGKIIMSNDIPLISIIVPIYKVEKYLEKCVESLINQNYTNLEIILVDDGSPDLCPQMCDEFQMKYNNVIVVHKENGGLSSARNAGVAIANGQYIGFVDSDDFVEKNMYGELYVQMKKHDADIGICGINIINKCVNKNIKCNMIEPGVYNSDEIALKIIKGIWEYVPVWNKLYKKDIIKKHLFPEGRIHEDEYTVHRFLSECENVVVLNNKYYNYIVRDGSIVHSGMTLKSFDALYAYYDRYNYYRTQKKGILAKTTFFKIEDVYCSRRLNIKCDCKDRIFLKKIDKEFYDCFIISSNHSFMWRIIFKINPIIYCFLFKIQRRIIMMIK